VGIATRRCSRYSRRDRKPSRLSRILLQELQHRDFVAPEAIIATTLKDGAVVRQRPVCVYPKQARYNGAGDINVAANFSCVSPGVEQPGASTADLNQIRNSLRQRALLGPVR
jgi:hypothetical protein